MPSLADQAVTRRKYAPKKRGGCITCKSRHVRCDQQRPRCGACKKSSRQCSFGSDRGDTPEPDGIKIVLWEPGQPSLSVQRMCQTPNQTSDESRALEYFRDVVAERLAGYFDATFWTGLAFRVSMSVASLRHAMIALASHWETVVVPGSDKRNINGNWECKAFALRQYNLAINEMRKSMELKTKPSTVELLMSNLMFICLEMFQNHYESALRQLSSGLYLFCEWESNRLKERRGANEPFESCSEVEVELSHIFRRLMTQSLLFPVRRMDKRLLVPSLTPEMPRVPDTFNSIEEARNSYNDCMSSIIHESKCRSLTESENSPNGDDIAEMHMINEFELQKWSETFEEFRAREEKNMTELERRNCIVIELQSIAVHIWALATSFPSEMEFDSWMPKFQKLVDLGSFLVTTKHLLVAPGQIPYYPKIDIGLILPMFLVASRCRDPKLRREAIEVIRNGPRQEGVWNGAILASVAERIIEIEEDGLETIRGCEDVPVHARVKVVDATIYAAKQRMEVIFRRPSGAAEVEGETILHEMISYRS